MYTSIYYIIMEERYKEIHVAMIFLPFDRAL